MSRTYLCKQSGTLGRNFEEDVKFFEIFICSIFVNICQYLSIFVNICQYLSIFVNICQYLSISVNICQYLSISVNICQYLSIFVNICQYLYIWMTSQSENKPTRCVIGCPLHDATSFLKSFIKLFRYHFKGGRQRL